MYAQITKDVPKNDDSVMLDPAVQIPPGGRGMDGERLGKWASLHRVYVSRVNHRN